MNARQPEAAPRASLGLDQLLEVTRRHACTLTAGVSHKRKKREPRKGLWDLKTVS